ncbi:MAG: asparagine synthase-related protein [Pseudomonadota bacterium]
MSGLAAVFDPAADPSVERARDRMVAAMAPLAADGVAGYEEEDAALGIALLHTTQECVDTPQPFLCRQSGVVVIFDGYLINHDRLVRDLGQRGIKLAAGGDAELVLQVYHLHGLECAKSLDGEFAFVIWDKRARRLILGRDHQGMRPLYFHHENGRVTVASTLAAMIAGLERMPEPSVPYLAQVATESIYDGEQTVWSGVKRVPRAHVLSFDANAVRSYQYWELPTDIRIRYRRDEDYVEHYSEVLKRAVIGASRTHRPLALEVSGGLDSSATYCLAHHLRESGQLLASDLRGYTLRGEVGSEADEFEFAQAAANFVGGTLCAMPLFEPGLDWYADQAVQECDIPTYTNGAMSILLEQQMVSDGCRVTLGGTGGDQWLEGTFDYYVQHLLLWDWREIKRAFDRDSANYGSWRMAKAILRRWLSYAAPASVVQGWRAQIGHPSTAVNDQLLKRSVRDGLRSKLAKHREGFSANEIVARKHRRMDRPFQQLAFDLVARQTSRGHIETRSPMFAREFIEFSATTPEHIRLRAGGTKWVHREAMRGVLPETIRTRESKASFPAPGMRKKVSEFCLEHAGLLTKDLCEEGALYEFFRASSGTSVDDDVESVVWGLYAVAAFYRYAHDQIDR